MQQLKRGVVVALAAAGLLSACGGGGGGSDSGSTPTPTPSPSVKTLSGTAATGAPIVGTLTIKDATGKLKDVVIAADGSYNIDVSDMTAPLILRAKGTVAGRTVTLYSAAMSADLNKTVNVTPFTDLILANVAGGLAEALFNGAGSKKLTDADLARQQQILRDRLLPVLKKLGLADSIDLLHTVFKADKTGLDAALDILKVDIDPDTLVATIRNTLTGDTVKDDVSSQTDTGALPEPLGDLTQSQKDLVELQAAFKNYVALFNQGDTPSVREQLAALIADDYLDNGDRKQDVLNALAKGDQLGANFDLLSVDVAKAKYCFRYSIDDHKSTEPGSNSNCALKALDGKWRLAGNGRLVEISVGSFAYWFPARNTVSNGVSVGIRDAHNLARYAVATGPGFPDGGVALVNNAPSNDWYKFENQAYGYDILDSGFGLDLGKVVKGGVYTVTLYAEKGAPQPLAVYQEKLDVAPLPDDIVKLIPALRFPSITSPKSVSDVSGASFTLSWTLPSRSKTRWAQVLAGMEDFYVFYGDEGRTVTSKRFDRVSAKPVMTGTAWVQVVDKDGRHFGTTQELTGGAVNNQLSRSAKPAGVLAVGANRAAP
ncbi:hypothetical protein [Jeongeupia naejangsanensis]|uniref:Carboxypeptidase regulatory-like domain-containing protein n=1 Tax=Jeongeupia naejangsanensis TaxID=613195 RepID=A0ABS2BMQ2_9NEIS|nr:hypothetical protein [Jeongeupia naejangsanensis]MBM3116887.1 hypothetical protein [Jeongeupia naejangsanensis]